MNLLSRIFPRLVKQDPALPQETAAATSTTSEKGRRPTPEDQIKYLYRLMWVDPDLRQAILDVREMDRLDGRVKRIHSRIARDTIKGGLIMQQAQSSDTLARQWDDFQRRLQLNRVEKLKSDARGLVMEGNLPIQWVLDTEFNVVAGVRMPSETILPNINEAGRFKDVKKAYIQFDVMTGTELAAFPLWQLFHARFDPDNFDDLGSLGRPFLDATRTTWRKLNMTEEDLVIRRRTRAPLRLGHVLKGASQEDIEKYRAQVEKDQHEITTDYYMNKEGGVSAVQGDANLDQIRDIVHLLDTFFAGSPLPKGMMGYTDGMARDILEDLKRDYYDEVDVLQDTLSFGYEAGFRLHLLLKGINPDAEDFAITFAERRTETPTQTTDRGLKLKALGLPQGMVWEELGFDAAYVEQRREWEAKNYDPYPDAGGGANPATVRITPGNGRKGESATDIGNK
ncbi:hypothetical protein [Nitrosovibrio sp. Nv6]|uniref:hypothetical protein n=1 Tax=Nitrosovibrio sp. Nv6 TaxID=1855340 RepID=UPI0008B495CB|nr:hypothetical protein [Nitrosovibrio sp. Nv6]SEO63411.1 hypothetical protein SAMN05216316_0669 [Nitrosovibrio sp. Nv6]